jgi:hypothetical protein
VAVPQFADGGDGLHLQRIAPNILNKQWRTADKRWSSSLVVGQGVDNSVPYKTSLLRNVTKGLRFGLTFWNA